MKWVLRWAVRASVLASEYTGGKPGYSVCARLWEARLTGVFGAEVAVYITDGVFFWDDGHCRKAWLLRQK